MAIKFLVDHKVDGMPPESFAAGEVVKNRAAESEMHFVRRKLAGFYDEKTGALFDHEGKVIDEKPSEAVILNVSDNRDGGVGRAGETELADGTPQRASSGPAEVVTTTAAPKAAGRAPAKSGAKKTG